jgi:hypothetical protein
MDMPITVKIALTKYDFVKAVRSFYNHQPDFLYVNAILIFLIIIGTLGLIRNGMNLFGIIFVVVASYNLVRLVSPYFTIPTLVSNISQDKASETVWRFSEDEIVVSSGSAENKIVWEWFQGFIETGIHFLLIHSENKSSFEIIPKQGFESSNHINIFRQLLRTKFTKSHRSFIVRNWRLILFVAVFLLFLYFDKKR